MALNTAIITVATLIATIKDLARIPSGDATYTQRLFDLIVSEAVALYKAEKDLNVRELTVTQTDPIISITQHGHLFPVEVILIDEDNGPLTIKEAGQTRAILPPSGYTHFNFSRTEVAGQNPTYKFTLSGPVTGTPSFTAKIRYKMLQIPDNSNSAEVLNYEPFIADLIKNVMRNLQDIRQQ